MDSQKWRDYAAFSRAPKSTVYWLEGVKMRRAEKRLAGKFDLLTCTTRAELETLRGFGIDTPSDWFPNGVDLDYFAPGAEDRDPGSIVCRRAYGLFPESAGRDPFLHGNPPADSGGTAGGHLHHRGNEPLEGYSAPSQRGLA